MGFAASQARLLLLTARKSDLEFRAQQITNSEMILAMQTEDIARVYAMKIGNQELRLVKSSDTTEHNFTASTLEGLSQQYLGSAMVLMVNGKEWKTDATPTGKYRNKEGVVLSTEEYNEKAAIVNGYQLVTEEGSDKGKYRNSDGEIITAEAYAVLKAEFDGFKPTYNEDGTNDYTGAEILEGIKNGSMEIVYKSEVGLAPEDRTPIDEINGPQFSVAYNTSDDQRADAEYRQKTAEIQVKEKRLQMDLTQVEAQQKACDTEIDSVKKIMDKNIERTFKVFS